MSALVSSLRLRHLRLIDAIAATGQVSAAADLLGVTQPAASRTLAEVERLVGERLFLRHPKGAELTPLGEVVARHATAVVGALDGIDKEAEAFRRGQAGVVRVGSVNGAAVGFVVPAVQKLKAVAQGALVSVDVAPSVDLMAGLLRGDHDMVLSRLPRDMDPSQFHIRRGRVEEIRYLVRSGHPLAGRAQLELGDLAGLTWVIQGGDMPIREAVEQAFASQELAGPRDTVDTASLLVALSYLQNSDAVAAVTQEVCDLLVTGGATGWTALDLRQSLILSPYQLIRRKDRPMTPISQRLHRLLEAEIAGERHIR